MSDDRLRDLEREWREKGPPAAERYLAHLIRTREVTEPQAHVAARTVRTESAMRIMAAVADARQYGRLQRGPREAALRAAAELNAIPWQHLALLGLTSPTDLPTLDFVGFHQAEDEEDETPLCNCGHPERAHHGVPQPTNPAAPRRACAVFDCRCQGFRGPLPPPADPPPMLYPRCVCGHSGDAHEVGPGGNYGGCNVELCFCVIFRQGPSGERHASDQCAICGATTGTVLDHGICDPCAHDSCECGHARGHHVHGREGCGVRECECVAFELFPVREGEMGWVAPDPQRTNTCARCSFPARPGTLVDGVCETCREGADLGILPGD